MDHHTRSKSKDKGAEERGDAKAETSQTSQTIDLQGLLLQLKAMREEDKAEAKALQEKQEKAREEDKAEAKNMREEDKAEAQKRNDTLQANIQNIQTNLLSQIQALRDENKNHLNTVHNEIQTFRTQIEGEISQIKGQTAEQNKAVTEKINAVEEEVQQIQYDTQEGFRQVTTDIKCTTHRVMANEKMIKDTTHMGTDKESENKQTPETPEEKLNDIKENNTEQEYNEDRKKDETYKEKTKTPQKTKINQGDIKYKIRNLKRKHLTRKYGKKGKLNKNRKRISKQVMQYIYTNANEHDHHTLILGERIGKRMVKKKPNLLHEGPFRIKNT